MKPEIGVLTLAVENVERSLDFYRRLGLKSPGIVGTEFVGDNTTPGGTVAMFELDGGLLLALYSRADLAKDAAIPLEPPNSGQFRAISPGTSASCAGCTRRATSRSSPP